MRCFNQADRSHRVLLGSLALFFLLILSLSGCARPDGSSMQEAWQAYNLETSAVFGRYKEQIKALDLQYLQSIVAYEYQESNAIAFKIIQAYESYLKALQAIEAPDFASELHRYQIESIQLEKQKWEGILENYMLYVFVDEALHEKILETIESIKSERERIAESFP